MENKFFSIYSKILIAFVVFSFVYHRSFDFFADSEFHLCIGLIGVISFLMVKG